MSNAVEIVPFVLALAGFALAALRPWWGVVALLAALPFNSFMVLVVGDLLRFDGIARIVWAGWKDAMVAGFVLATIVAVVRAGRFEPRPRSVWLLAAAVLALSAVYVVVAQYRLTALYAYRTLYAPLVLMLAMLALAAVQGVPEWLTRRMALAIVIGGVIAAVAAWPQVYVGGFEYLDHFFHEPGEALSPSYIAYAIRQPRAIGTFNSPNEFGAYLAIVTGVLLTPNLVRFRPGVKGWVVVAVVLAAVLSFSRSGWVASLVVAAVIGWLLRDRIRPLMRLREAVDRRGLRRHGPPLIVMALLLVFIANSSDFGGYVEQTATGRDPSAAARPGSAEKGITVIRANPMGVGLGMAGPKSVRFGEVGAEPILASETWYIAYAMQVGVFGLLLLLLLVLSVARALWSRRHEPWAAMGLAIGAGLAVGAIFIPIIDEPAVATPLWTVLAVGLIQAERARQPLAAMPDRARGAAPVPGEA